MNLIIVGAGEVLRKHWGPVLAKSDDVRVIGVVDPWVDVVSIVREFFGPEVPIWKSVSEALCQIPTPKLSTVALVLTADHFPTIMELIENGITKMIVEKPIVSRDWEVHEVRMMRLHNRATLYGVDQYIPKTLSLAFLAGAFSDNDPRRQFLKVAPEVSFGALRAELGEVEGVSVSILESGSFCLPDLAKRKWLRTNIEIGGMLRDLGTHALAPLIASGLIDEGVEVVAANLMTIADDDRSLMSARRRSDVEMYSSALLRTKNGTPISLQFGKVPGRGGVWAIDVRFAGGNYQAGLRTSDGATVRLRTGEFFDIRLACEPIQYHLWEARQMFNSVLETEPSSNVSAIVGALKICSKIRQKYLSGE